MYQYLVTPADSNPVLQFAFQDNYGYIYLDDVRLGTSSATPEVGSLAGFGCLLVLGGVWGLCRARAQAKRGATSNGC